jgi:hypothetical protein
MTGLDSPGETPLVRRIFAELTVTTLQRGTVHLDEPLFL